MIGIESDHGTTWNNVAVTERQLQVEHEWNTATADAITTTTRGIGGSIKETMWENGPTTTTTTKKTASSGMPRILVIYFPQYHRDPINDKNWGDNFTDWVSLRKSRRTNRAGYRIPRPLEDEFANGLGYYDLQDVRPRQRQGQLAQQYGVDGFIYHHYWFYDKSHPGPTLAKPLLNMLKDGHPDRPFLLNWCATKWVNVWMGKAIFQTIPTNKNRAITLQEQFFEPTVDEIREHYDWLSQFFHHPNYIKMNDNTQPVLMLYSYDARAVPILQQLRKFAIEDGFTSLYLVVGRSGPPLDLFDPSQLVGIDLESYNRQIQPAGEVPVHTVYGYDEANKLVSITTTEASSYKGKRFKLNVTKTTEVVFNQSMTYPYPLDYVNQTFNLPKWCLPDKNNNGVRRPSHRTAAADAANGGRPTSDFVPEMTGVVTVFDNTPRREYQSSKMYNQGPPDEVLKTFETNLYASLYYQKCCVIDNIVVDKNNGASDGVGGGMKRRREDMMEERIVAINAWNEWAEGMAIEPSDVYKYGWLETIQKVKREVESVSC
jgi:hypothetical protein